MSFSCCLIFLKLKDEGSKRGPMLLFLCCLEPRKAETKFRLDTSKYWQCNFVPSYVVGIRRPYFVGHSCRWHLQLGPSWTSLTNSTKRICQFRKRFSNPTKFQYFAGQQKFEKNRPYSRYQNNLFRTIIMPKGHSKFYLKNNCQIFKWGKSFFFVFNEFVWIWNKLLKFVACSIIPKILKSCFFTCFCFWVELIRNCFFKCSKNIWKNSHWFWNMNEFTRYEKYYKLRNYLQENIFFAIFFITFNFPIFFYIGKYWLNQTSGWECTCYTSSRY